MQNLVYFFLLKKTKTKSLTHTRKKNQTNKQTKNKKPDTIGCIADPSTFFPLFYFWRWISVLIFSLALHEISLFEQRILNGVLLLEANFSLQKEHQNFRYMFTISAKAKQNIILMKANNSFFFFEFRSGELFYLASLHNFNISHRISLL